jgi:hypothetical protein
MRDLINICENRKYGPLGRQIRNDGDLGKLEDALALWVEGECREAEKHLLRMSDLVDTYYECRHPMKLYRGLRMDNLDVEGALLRGLPVGRHEGKQLESWSTDPHSVYEYMFDIENWIMVRHVFPPTNIFLDLVYFHDNYNPHTRMNWQNEVIVRVPTRNFYPASDIINPLVNPASMDNF